MSYKHIVYGVLLVGCVTRGFTKPANENSTAFSEDEIDMQNDYNEQVEYTDEENPPVPDSPPVISTQKVDPTNPPYFEQEEYIKQAKSGNNITLECPVKNLDSTSNVILWYKEDKVVVAGSKPVGDRYVFNDYDHTLSIMNVTKKDSGNYFCEVQPQKIRLHANVEIGEESNAEAQSNSNIVQATIALPFICILLITEFF